MTINVDLLQQTLLHIEEHPEEWYQNEWRCGATACFAGHAALLDGARWVDPRLHASYYVCYHGEEQHVELAATEALGLSFWQAETLFEETNTLDDLREIVADLVAENS